MPQPRWLRIEGARQNNLKNVSLAIPHDAVTVVTGVSGSGKSSLAFDTLFAEGQWRYVESLSTYARMFLDRVDRPDVDRIENIRPAIALREEPRADGPLHGGHGHRALRLPSPPLRPHRARPLPALRKRGAERRRGHGDGGTGARAPRRARPRVFPAARPRRRGHAGDLCRATPPRLRAGQGRRGGPRAGRRRRTARRPARARAGSLS